jgi:Fe-S-cluster containining protein
MNRPQQFLPDESRFRLHHSGGNSMLKSIAFDLVQLRQAAEEKTEENWQFRQFLKMAPESKQIDKRVFAATDRVWSGIDCTTCANCCRVVRPSFSDEEVDRLAGRLGVNREHLIDSWLERTEEVEKPWQTRTTPCPFLKENRCSVYEDRPADCMGYPHLYEPDFASRTIGMIDRTSTCPIVFEVMEDLKKSLGFRRSRRG